MNIKAGLLALTVSGVAVVAWMWTRSAHPPASHLPPASVQILRYETPASPTPPSSPAVAHETVTPATAENSPAPKPDVARRTAQARQLIQRRYASLYKRLGLNPEKRDALTQLLIDVRETSRDYAGANAATGTDASQDRESFDLSVNSLRDGLREKIKALLGDEDFARYLEFEGTMQQTAVIERLQKALRTTADPISDQQAAQLQDLLRELHKTRVDDAIVDRASAFLSARQIEMLQAQQQRRQLGPQKDPIQQEIRASLPPKK